MFAYLMDEPGGIRFGEIPDPVCEEDGVLLETEAVSICSTDVSYFRGHLSPIRWPIVPGHEYVGRVVKVGPALCGIIDLGARICYWGQTDFGGMARFRSIRPILPGSDKSETSWYTERSFYDADQAAAVLIPPSVASTTATIIEPLTSVLRSVLANPPCPGDVCVVLGCGPSGQLAVQVLVKLLGVRSVLVVDKDDDRIALAMAHGAELGFNIEKQFEELREFVRNHDDRYAEYLFDALPHVAPSPKAGRVRELGMGLLQPGSRYVIYGATAIPQHVSTWMILAKGLRLRATPFDVRKFSMARSAMIAQVALRLIESGLIQTGPVVSSVVEMGDEESVLAAFQNYGREGEMKVSLVSDIAMISESIRGRPAPAGSQFELYDSGVPKTARLASLAPFGRVVAAAS